MKSLGWIAAGLVSIAIGLTVWATAFVLVPVGVVLIIIGIVSAVRRAGQDSNLRPRD